MRRLLGFLFLLVLIAGLYFYVSPIYFRPVNDPDVLILYGNVDVRQVDLGFRVSGRIQTMLYEEGDFVPKGSLMAFLDEQPYLDQVRRAEARVFSTKTSLANANRLLNRRNQLIGTGAVSKEDYEDTLSSRDVTAANLKETEAALGISVTDLKDTRLYAPNDGSILTRIREPGAIVNPADPIYTLSLVSPVWIRAFVPEVQLGNIYFGMAAEIYTDTPGSPIYKGHVGFISPVAEFTPKTVETTELRTDLVYRLRVIADNPDRGLRQGMPVTVKLHLNRS